MAIGYSTGIVYIVDIEDKEVLEKLDLELEMSEEFEDAKTYGITCITWAVREGALENATEYNVYVHTFFSFGKFDTSIKIYTNLVFMALVGGL